ncbi:immunoglobulin-like domain-containing receptor 2 isoform X3 [Siniperca chuatsi]|uniref:immunoglobulin-like domain-containing receptor 2 isoform X3 n=1 Tax=Siniperca chuatsi TaxID=119488 RepID=UPI001CE0BF10|nr:immunoglobulin-like domain-containing receptor 2 isoform X3 [Siniperca chuatsi]
MRRKRKEDSVHQKTWMNFTCRIWKMFLLSKWWIFIVWLTDVLPPRCSGVHVFVRDEKRYAVLFQSVVLPCQYNSVSTQTPVVQWVYKSYCRDRTRDSFTIPDSLSGGLGGGGLTGATGGAGGGYETGMTASYLDCADSSRTVRTVASISGSSVTLSEYYKNRDISIINKADLRVGEVQWGDSGVYICKVVISDDLEGQNEASVELLVLGFSGVPEDLLPDFDLKIMPEWVFVAAVVLGSVLFLLLVGVCWCQCCPHSCCCYVSCWCCPDTCCCPRHLYEAGKGIKTGTSTPQPAYPPYFVTGVPTMIPIAPPSLVDKMSSVPPSDGSLLTAACSLSELSSLHEGDTSFRQTYRNVQKKALPAIPDHDHQPEPQRYCDNRSPEPQHYRNNPPSPQRYRDDPDSEPRRCQDEPLPPRRYSDDPPSSSQSRRLGRNQRQQNHSEDENHNRWNPRSEHLQRKTYRTAGRTGSLDELEEFAASYKQRGSRGVEKREEERGDYEMELLEYSRYPSYRDCPPQHYHNDENELGDSSDREDHPRRNKKNGHIVSPLPSPKKRRGTWDSERPAPPPPRVSPPSTSSQEKDYDGTFLNSLLERKAKLRGVGQGKSGARGEEDSDTPSKGSSKKSSGESSRHCSRSPSNRPEADSLPPYSETERSRTDRPSPRPLPTNTRSSQPPAQSLPGRREEPRDKTRKVNTLLSRDSLIV